MIDDTIGHLVGSKASAIASEYRWSCLLRAAILIVARVLVMRHVLEQGECRLSIGSCLSHRRVELVRALMYGCVGTALGAWFGRRLDVSLNNDKRINILKLNAESCDDISHCYMLILSSSSTIHTDRTPITWEYWYHFGDRQYWQRRSCSWCVT